MQDAGSDLGRRTGLTSFRRPSYLGGVQGGVIAMIRWLGLSVLLCMLVFWNVACGPTTCKPGEVCPVGTVCKAVGSGTGDITYVCIPANPKSDIGALCMADNYRCLSGYCYMPTQDVKQSYCSRLCDDKEPCPPGFQCQVVGTNLKVCTLNLGSSGGNGCRCGKANASCTSNGHDDCDVAAGYFCLSAGPRDPKAKCVKECSPGISQSCPTGLSCLRSQTGRFLCMASKRGEGGIGDSCADGGKADCLRNYFCYEQYPNDRAAFCSRFCSPYDENDCGKGSVCESPREQDPWLCVPRGRKKIGENCSTEGFLACNSGICAAPQARSRTRFCTERCDPDDDKCPAGFKCRLFASVYRYLCDKSAGGDIGAFCNKNGGKDCKSGLCISPAPGAINRICSQVCDDALRPCPGGYKCDKDNKYCIPNTGTKKIGEKCTGPNECVFGTCITPGGGRDNYCSQRCTENKQCPDGYECRLLEFTQKFCQPKQTAKGKQGDPCPGGAGDCATNYCINDILKGRTFCTATCSKQKPCAQPYICKKIGNRSFCTPADYSPP